MKELNRKVFRTIFFILSLFIITGITTYNVSSYKKEYESVKRTLKMVYDRGKKEPKSLNNFPPKLKERNMDNMMIMDYEVYTVRIENGRIEKTIHHSEENSDFDIEKIAKKIIKKKEEIHIGNLYRNNNSYLYLEDTIVVINTKLINQKLIRILLESIFVLFAFEIMIYYISKMLTKRITKPANESFMKQKEFIADASHELKTPLAVIIASSDELVKDKKNEKYIDNIKYESERMNTLIKSLLDLSKLENGITIHQYKEENISKIIERVSLTFEGIAFEEDINIQTNIEENIHLKCSKEEIEKLISILLDNAIKHSYKKSSIIVNVNKDKKNINIEIINFGDPIKNGEEEKIFERFYRADKSRNRDTNRYGLGLAIAKNIVINHNGIIKAYSKDGKTTFKIILKK